MTQLNGPSKLERLIEEQERVDAQRMRELREQYPDGAQQEAAAPKSKRGLVVALSALAVVALAGGSIWAWSGSRGDQASEAKPAATSTPAEEAEATPEPTEEPEEDPKDKWDIDSASSLQVVVNKQRPIDPIDFAPTDLSWPNVPNSTGNPLRSEAAEALQTMHGEALAAGFPFGMESGYVDYWNQELRYNNAAATDGEELADSYVARPGYSDRQTGLSVDLVECEGCGLNSAFADTASGAWILENAHRFGFVQRYPDDKADVTGYSELPWRFRYVGTEVAEDMHDQDVTTLEEFFDLPDATEY